MFHRRNLLTLFTVLPALSTSSPTQERIRDGPYRFHASQAKRAASQNAIVTDPTVLSGKTFDYVIVGAGTAGLVIASRLSANSSVTVAVIEAGTDGSDVEDQILAPAYAYFNGIASMKSPYDWHYNTANQTNLNNRSIYWPRGKIIGGSSAVNGLYMTRANQIEHDSWAELLDSKLWTWDSVYPYMKKSETWNPQNSTVVSELGMVDNSGFHGTDGPIHYSYPGYVYPQISEWIPTLENLGIPSTDPAGGKAWGVYVATSAIDPTSYTRSYAKTGYLDPYTNRSNLIVLSNYTVTKIKFDTSNSKNVVATGVEFASGPGQTIYTVNAKKEVILSAGVINSPKILLLSGIGPKDQLDSVGISTVIDLPGVGNHLTDHLSAEIMYNATGTTDSQVVTGDSLETNSTVLQQELALWKTNPAESLFSAPNDAIAYVNLTTILGNSSAVQSLINELSSNNSFIESYTPYPTVNAGYNATFFSELNTVYPSPVGAVEILMFNTGSYGAFGSNPTTKVVSIQVAIQHPLSRGSLKLASSDPFADPIIDPRYFSVETDVQILRAGFQYAKTIAATAPLSGILGNQLSPGSTVVTDADWENWLRSSVSTEYHPAGGAAMLPLEYGGVVDETMIVYGAKNLRVIDSSIVPISFSAHMTAPLYGLAENAYAIMSGVYANETKSSPGTSPSTTPSTTPKGSKSSASKLNILSVPLTISLLGLFIAL